MARTYDTTKSITNTKVNVNKLVWSKFSLIFKMKGQKKEDALTEALRDYNAKYKDVLTD